MEPGRHESPPVPVLDLALARHQEADANDQAEPLSLDAVLGTEVVEHGKHDAIPGGHDAGDHPKQ